MKKFLFDLFPLLLFFIAYRYADIYFATKVAIAASVLQIAWLKIRGKPIDAMNWVSLIVIAVFGGLTIYLHSDTFIKWKPTVLYWLFGGALLFSRYVLKRNLLEKFMGKQITLKSAHVWDKLNLMWAAFFAVAGALNLYVAFSGAFTEEQWVSFKAFGLLIMTLLFVVGQSFWLGRHLVEPAETAGQTPAIDNDKPR
ncbi:septation protein A [Bordetella genomosp. 5]|uniref:Inner membrane-spanning protein YciB n=1 Tax=Bordetella genomosp. 5 TaxID=1395608 RepID=A0A261TYM6_9BORD|nr:septation protein A [Bordetella genomosp. 5]OZI45355.1 septation protein A [Bordetella genomosp. 5]OZI54495.1 septation protein A [Bordetella genomosp. 5]